MGGPTCGAEAEDTSIVAVPDNECFAANVQLENLGAFLGEPVPKLVHSCARTGAHEYMLLRRRTKSEDCLEIQDRSKGGKCLQNVRSGYQRVFFCSDFKKHRQR